MTESICSRSTLLVRIRQHQPIYSLCDKDMLLLLLKLDIMSEIVFGSNLHSPPITTLHYIHRNTLHVDCRASHHGGFPDAFASHNASKPSSADDLQESYCVSAYCHRHACSLCKETSSAANPLRRGCTRATWNLMMLQNLTSSQYSRQASSIAMQ